MTIIDSETVVVFNYNELKSVLEGNTYSYIYFGDNITLSGGINVNLNRTNLTIDGTYDNIRYTYTDYPSSAYPQTILLIGSASTSMNITVKNIDVIGRNFYGVICVYDSSNFSNVTVSYENIVYEGPQLAFNPYSSLIIKDSDINIIPDVSPANEVAETRNVTLGGNVTINSVTTGTSIFWLRHVVGGAYPYINILPDANISITSVNRYLYFISSATHINITFGSGSTTNITTATGISYDDGHRAQNVLIDTNATVNIEQTEGFGSTSTWVVIGEFKMNTGSSLKMISDFAGVTGNYCLQFIGTNASFNINNPNSLIMYNRATNAIHSSNTIPYNLNISQYNRWLSAKTPLNTAGNIDNIPTYSWYKIENMNNLTASGTITSSTTTMASNNLTPTEIAQLPDLSNFLLNNSPVLSMGRPSLTIGPITDLSTDITGTTTPYSDIKINYNSSDHLTVADASGNFIYSYSSALPEGTIINFIANLANSFLYRFRTVQIVYIGDLYISEATKQVFFNLTPFQTTPTLCNRSTPLKVVIQDERVVPSPWNLYATINFPLTNENGKILENGLIFIDESDNTFILSDTPTLVYSDPIGAFGTTDVEWQDEKGILLQLNIVPIESNTTYRTDINWILE